MLLKVFLLLLESHSCRELITVGLGSYLVVDSLYLLVALEGLSLAPDDGTPFIEIAPGVRWVIPLVVIRQRLQLLSFVFHRLFHTLSVNFQRVDQVVHF